MIPATMPPPSDERRPASAGLLAAAVVVLAFAIPAAVLIALQVNHGPRFEDQLEYHIPTIWQIAGTWPRLDVNAYPAAMTPGYHLLMAAVAGAGGGVIAMQALTALLTCGMLATLAWVAGRRRVAADAILLCLPVAFSPYIFSAGIYIEPHNLAWWGVLAVILLALRPQRCAAVWIGFAIVFTALVMVYQIQAWTIAPMLAGTWILTLAENEHRLHAPRRRIWQTIWVLIAALPAALLLAWFVKQWGGLAPHKQGWVRPVAYANLSAIAMVLAVVGALGVFYLPWFWRAAAKRWSMIGAAIALLAALIPLTTYDKDAGRWGGLWNIAGKLPTFAQRSPAIVLLAALGGFVLGAMFASLDRRDRWIFAAALAGFAAAHAAINQAWQRYYEPMILIMLVLAASRSNTPMSAAQQRLSRILLAAITVVQIGLTAMSLRS